MGLGNFLRVSVAVMCMMLASADTRTTCDMLCDNTDKPDCLAVCQSRLARLLQKYNAELPAPTGRGLPQVGYPVKTDEEEKRISNFVRIGKSLPEEEKRRSAFVRIGKAIPDEMRRGSAFVRIGKDLPDEDKRVSSFVRIGKSPPGGEKRVSSFVRIGKDTMDEEKRMSSFVRIGKNADDLAPGEGYFEAPAYYLDEDVDKRASQFVRIGRGAPFSRSARSYPKRISSFVRIGKRPAAFYPTGNYLLDEEPSDYYPEQDKRASSFVRIGRAGYPGGPQRFRSGSQAGTPEVRRASSFVRIGRSGDTDEDQVHHSE